MKWFTRVYFVLSYTGLFSCLQLNNMSSSTRKIIIIRLLQSTYIYIFFNENLRCLFYKIYFSKNKIYFFNLIKKFDFLNKTNLI